MQPPPNSGRGGIVPVSRRRLATPGGDVLSEDLSVEFQKLTFTSPLSSPYDFSPPPTPSEPLLSYCRSQGHGTPLSLQASRFKNGTNTKDVPLPALAHLLGQQVRVRKSWGF